jgi:SAM-dependent methyltransferase
MSDAVPPTPLIDTTARSASWSRYWSSGVLHSCPGSFRGNYDGAIAAFWHRAFDALMPGQRVLDIATGNGALPRLLLGLDEAADRGCSVDAIDLAELAPNWLHALDADRRARLRLHSGVMAERLPFEDGTFDLVVSQYGIEYADLGSAFAEAGRVLGAQGRLRMLMHHRDALPVQKGEVEARLLQDEVLADDGLLAAAARMLPWMAMAASTEGRAGLQHNAAANADRAAFNASQQRIASAVAAAGDDAAVLIEARDQVQRLFAIAQTQGAAQAGVACQRLREAFQEQLLRTRELVAHALDEARMTELMHALDRLGFASVRAEPLHYREHLMGWTLQADRAGN